ncbi:MAG TPA: sulfatase-like hydrolase/transferase [Candidatus Hydrogenedentes bacterium]|nr:sulfatase-like hydrolase/transferase [Candidatus Hydrogenedentota bacterium]HRT18925.1 sulfatase-like hydrolase/transferase [Candidatus Hydrogenedentota bacterium]HRT64963.1 sulfatase-like hydrolase/transferase [Candidatus Hydrogenedentota bacterium]
MQIRRIGVFIFFLILLAAGLRFYCIHLQSSVWQAEICGLDLLKRATGIRDILFDRTVNRESTPLYFILLYFVHRFSGDSLWILRSVGIFFGVLSIPLLYACGRRLLGRKAGMLAALWLALSPYHIIKCRDIRPYPLVLLLGLLSAYAFIRIMEDDKKVRWWLASIVANVLLVYTHALGCWLLLAEGLVLLIFYRKPFVRIIMWTAGHFLFLIPLAVLMAGRYSLVDPPLYSTVSDWLSSVFYMDAFRIAEVAGHFDADYHAGPWPSYLQFLLRLFPALLAALFVFTAGSYLSSVVRMIRAGIRSRTGAGHGGDSGQVRLFAFLLLWVAVPSVTMILITLLGVPLFQQRYIVYVLPATYLIVADAVLSLPERHTRMITLSAFTATLCVMSFLAIRLPMNADYERAARHIMEHRSGMDPVLLIPGQDVSGLPIALKPSRLPLQAFDRMHELLEAAEDRLAGHSGLWVVFDFVSDAFSKARSRIFARYCAFRGIRYEKTVFLGRCDVVVFQCTKGAEYLPWADESALDRFHAQLGDSVDDLSLRRHAAAAFETRGRYHEAAEEYRAILRYGLDYAGKFSDLSNELMMTGYDDWGGPDFSAYFLYEAADDVARVLRNNHQEQEAEAFARDMRARFPGNPYMERLFTGEKALAPHSPRTDRSFLYRLDDHFPEASLASVPPDSDSKPSVMGLIGSDQQWSTGKESSRCQFENGVLLFSAQERDYIQTPDSFRCYGPEVDAIRLVMTVSGPEKILVSWHSKGSMWEWSDDDGHALIPILVLRQREEKEYLLKVGGLPLWQGREIDGLRIIAPTAGEIAIRNVDIVMRAGLFGGKAGTAAYRLGNSLRPCVYMKPPVRLSYPMKIPDHARFTASLGVVSGGHPVDFTLEIATPDGSEPCLSRRVDPQTPWLNVDAPLGRYAHMETELILRAECDAPGQVALWANPIVFQESAALPEKPNILFYVVDSLRADHLDLYGYHRNTAPALTEFARGGAWFRKCIAPSTCTRSSMVSIFAGIEAIAHGLGCWDMAEPVVLATFPEALRSVGYTTAAFTENPCTPLAVPQRRAFCSVDDFDELTASRDGSTFGAVQTFFQEHKNRPFFVYIHTMECHVHFNSPEEYGYESPPSYQGLWAAGRKDHEGCYDETIRFADDNFARVLGLLRDEGLEANTLVVFTSDHGEGFGQHPNRIIHGYEPYDELVGVPLVMCWPGRIPSGQAIENIVQSIDLAPTFLDILGLPPNSPFQGLSLRPLLQGERPDGLAERVLYAYEGQNLAPETSTVAIVKDRWKLFGRFPDTSKILFDLASDPLEMTDCTPENAGLAANLEAHLTAHWPPLMDLRKKYEPLRTTAVQIMDTQWDEMLKELGNPGR